MLKKMFRCALITCMLFSKPSKKTKKSAEDNAVATEMQTAVETSKPRASRSSKSKSGEASETGSVKHRKPATKPAVVASETAPVIESTPAVEMKSMAAVASFTPTTPIQSTEPAVTISQVPSSAAPRVSREEVARLAYSYWVERGYAPGSPEHDWLRAERELAVTR